jgi:hypothetical protein
MGLQVLVLEVPPDLHKPRLIRRWLQDEARRRRFGVPRGWEVVVEVIPEDDLLTRSPQRVRLSCRRRPARRDTSESVTQLLGLDDPERTPR